MASCPMCNADDVSDDPKDMNGHDITQHPEEENKEETKQDENE